VSHSESNIQARTRLAATAKRWRLWRNNRGAAKTDSGSYIRFGLANDSKTIGDVLKSGDLIGWRPVIITADMVGKVLAQIVSVECKAADWKPSENDKHYLAQKRWIDLVNREGGYAVFITDPSQL
jgi:hypothetical protein